REGRQRRRAARRWVSDERVVERGCRLVPDIADGPAARGSLLLGPCEQARQLVDPARDPDCGWTLEAQERVAARLGPQQGALDPVVHRRILAACRPGCEPAPRRA